MRPKTPTLTEQELEIMKIVWERERATVRDVYESLLERRKIAYTTVMTMMNILEQKKYLRKSSEDRAYILSADQAQEAGNSGNGAGFVDRVFNGSAEPLLVHLIQDRKLTNKDLDELARMIRKER